MFETKTFTLPAEFLRDYFAAAALNGILSAPPDCVSQDMGPNARANPVMAAHNAYEFADAMMIAREERQKRKA